MGSCCIDVPSDSENQDFIRSISVASGKKRGMSELSNGVGPGLQTQVSTKDKVTYIA
jgi:hypothetical protein